MYKYQIYPGITDQYFIHRPAVINQLRMNDMSRCKEWDNCYYEFLFDFISILGIH